MAHPGKYSNVEVLRKYVVGASFEAGTTQTVGSGLKPRRTGFWKTNGSEESDEAGMMLTSLVHLVHDTPHWNEDLRMMG